MRLLNLTLLGEDLLLFCPLFVLFGLDLVYLWWRSSPDVDLIALEQGDYR